MNIEELITDLRARVNPQYYDQIGTESYERHQVVKALEYLATENERLKELMAKRTREHQQEMTSFRLRVRSQDDATFAALREENKRLKANPPGIWYDDNERQTMSKNSTISLGKGMFVLWPVKVDGVHGVAFIKADTPMPVNTEHPGPSDGMIDIGEGDFLLTFDNLESLRVLMDKLGHVHELMSPPKQLVDLRVGAKDGGL